MKTILVTGGAGYIGSHTVYCLRERGWPVVVVDDLSAGDRRVVPRDVPLHVGDIGARSFIAPLLLRHRPWAVLHFAASTSAPDSVRDPVEYYRNNVGGTCTLLEACVEAKVDIFLFSSSAAVYGTPPHLPVNESASTRPINPYGASKLMCESMIADTAQAAKLRWAALRYFNVAGADAMGRSGPMGSASTNLIKAVAELAAGRRRGITLHGDDYPTADGTCVRDFIHVADVADAHALILDYLCRGGASGIFNCGYGRGHSVREVLAVAETIAGPLNVEVGRRRAGDPPVLIADTSRIRELGWAPQHDEIADMLRTAIAWERQRPWVTDNQAESASVERFGG